MLTFGTDPEVAVVYDNDFVYPSVAFFEELKIKPEIDDVKHPVFITNKDFTWMADGVAFEATLPPVNSAQELYKIWQNALESLEEYVSKFYPEGKIYKKPTANFDCTKYFHNANERMQQMNIFGCDPDMDAILGEEYICDTIDASVHPYRYFGAHLHISGDEFLVDYPIPAIQLLAITVGNFSISTSNNLELEKLRAYHYGQPGRFRRPVYSDGTKGLEYRTPSISWLKNLETMEGVFEYAHLAVHYLKNPQIGKEIISQYLEPTIESITTANNNLANEILGSLQ